jgi:hypothetical protein
METPPSVEYFEKAIAEIFELALEEYKEIVLIFELKWEDYAKDLPCEMYERYPDECVAALDEALVRFLRKGAPWENFRELGILDTAMFKSFPFIQKLDRYFVLMGILADNLHRRSCSPEVYLWYRLEMVNTGDVPHPLDALLPELCVARVRSFSRCQERCIW